MQTNTPSRPALFSDEHLNLFKEYCQGMVLDQYGKEIPITTEMIDAACQEGVRSDLIHNYIQ